MYKNQTVPFEYVVEKLHIQRDLSKPAVYQVMFNFINSIGENNSLYGIDSKEIELGGSKATTDINLFAWENNGCLFFNFEYCADLFKQSTIERMGKHFQNLLNFVMEEPSCEVGKISILTTEEKEDLLETEYANVKAVDEQYTAYNLFENQVKITPDNIALKFENKSLTYAELNTNINKVANTLINSGVSQGDRIGLFMDRSIEMIIGMFAVMKVGAAYVPLDPHYPEDRIENIIRQAGIRIVLTQRILLGDVIRTDDVEVMCVESVIAECGDDYAIRPNVTVDVDTLMYILFTSGSTGEPKGVMITHRNYASYFKSVMKEVGISEPLQYIIVTTFAADLGSFCIYAPLLTGGCVHIVSYERSTDVEWLADYFENNHIDVMKLVPSHFEAFQASERAESIIPDKMLIFAGEALRKETVRKVWKRKADCRVINKYGPSETTVTATLFEITRDNIDDHDSIPVGKPLSNTYTYVLDSHMAPVPFGVIGELYIGGWGVAKGYLGRRDLTDERFLADVFHSESNFRIYKTGDLVRRCEDGNLLFEGRADRQVKIRGYRIELGGIEGALKQLPEVKDAVLDVRRDPDDSYLCAYVTLVETGEKLQPSDIKNRLKARIPDYWMPRHIVVIDHIPLTSNGKIDYKSLPEPTPDIPEEGKTYIREGDEGYEIAQVWSEILGVPKISLDDNFFDMGGDSFKAMKLVRKLDHNVSVIDLFKYPTIRGLLERNSVDETSQEGRLVRLTPKPSGKTAMNYICFPYAGGSAISFQPVADALPSSCQLFGVKLPGHDFSDKEDVGKT